MKTKQAKNVRIQSLARASTILEAISREGVASLAAICKVTGLNKTTAFYLVESLVDLGFAERIEAPRGYRLGLRNLELGRAVQRRMSLLEVSRPALVRLCSATKETVNLAVPYLLDALIIESLEGSYGVRATSYSGTRAPYHATACGKAILAHVDETTRLPIYADQPMAAFTPNTLTDAASFERQLVEVRRIGYALDLEEMEDSAHCVAAPIFDAFGQVAGAISLSGPKSRMTFPALTEAARLIVAETTTITKRLANGRGPPTPPTTPSADLGNHVARNSISDRGETEFGAAVRRARTAKARSDLSINNTCSRPALQSRAAQAHQWTGRLRSCIWGLVQCAVRESRPGVAKQRRPARETAPKWDPGQLPPVLLTQFTNSTMHQGPDRRRRDPGPERSSVCDIKRLWRSWKGPTSGADAHLDGLVALPQS